MALAATFCNLISSCRILITSSIRVSDCFVVLDSIFSSAKQTSPDGTSRYDKISLIIFL